MQRNNSHVSTCIINSQFIYIIGGYNEECFFNEIEKYTIILNSWETIFIASNLQLPLRDSSLLFFIDPSYILIAGGNGGEDNYDS